MSAAIFVAGFIGAGFAARLIVKDSAELALQREIVSSKALALEAVKELQQRMQNYAELIARKPALAEVVYKGSDIERASFFADEFAVLKQLDPTVSVMETTNLIGIVLARGHNPRQFGDDKSKLKEVNGAIDGKSMKGLTVSPASGQASFNAVVPVKNSRGIVGTLTIGARAGEAFVQEIKERSSTEVVTVFKGKVTSSTLDKDVSIPLPEALANAKDLTSSVDTDLTIAGKVYGAQFTHLSSFAGEGIVIGTLVDKAPFAARIGAFDQSLTHYGLMALPLVIAAGFFFGYVSARPIEQTARALGALSAGEQASLAQYSRKSDEIGDMARSFGALVGTVEDAFKLRQMVETMPLGVLSAMKSDGYRIDYINPALVARLSASDVALARPARELVGTNSLDLLKEASATAAGFDALGHDTQRLRLVLGSATFMVTISRTVAKDGTTTGIIASFDDVSERLQLAATFERAVLSVAEGVSTTATSLHGHATEVHGIAGDAQERAGHVARAAEESAASVTTVAAAADELLASVDEIRRQMEVSSQIVGQADTEAQDVTRIMVDLKDVSHKIGSVVQMIGAIASQTNLLALNATIEAARAGEAGRGFAVVASEVKSLAAQTSRAADDVVDLVRAVQSRTESASDAITRITGTIGQLASISVGISAAVEQQRRATEEIARTTQSTAESTNEVATGITTVSSASQQTEVASSDMVIQADTLQETVETLRSEVDRFLARLAA
jgi:methyl-accepting chemotaxis protein